MISDVVDLIKSEHTYSVPEIIAVPINGGSTDYLKWVKESTKKKEVNVIGNTISDYSGMLLISFLIGLSPISYFFLLKMYVQHLS